MTRRPRRSAPRTTEPLDQRIGAILSTAVLTILNLVTLLYTVLAWLITPSDIGDTNLIDAAWSTAFFAGTLPAIITAILTLIPVAIRWLRVWWLLIPALLFILATARWTYIDHLYPAFPRSATASVTGSTDPRPARW
jgi:steroid 5-alpha reductase family enzyme